MPDMRATRQLYARLLDAADQVLRKPFDPARSALLEQLGADVDAAVRAPAEDRSIFEEERLLVQALQICERGRRFNEIDHQMAGAQIAGVLIPWVQEHSVAALAAEGKAPSTTDQDYAKR